MRPLAFLLFLFLAALLILACSAGSSADCPTGWDRFVATLEGMPTPASDSSCADSTGPTETTDPNGFAGSTLCLTAVGDESCLGCIKASCCEQALACTNESACACLLACRAGGATAASCSASCAAAPDASYTAATNCTSAHCAAQCPRLQ
jgi:hypothetical protein